MTILANDYINIDRRDSTGTVNTATTSTQIYGTTANATNVTQGTSRTTGVTINSPVGTITLFSAAGSATYATFTVTNSFVAAGDVVDVSIQTGANLYSVLVTATAAGSFNLSVAAVSGTAIEAPVINFVVTKNAIV